MIEFTFKSDVVLEDETKYADWIYRIIKSEMFVGGDLDYIFCSDDFLLSINQEYLDHDTYTDIVTFDYSEGKTISGDIFISIDRVKDNANTYGVEFSEELLRVMCHGVLHLMGYGDKSDKEAVLMRSKEEEKMKMFHVEP